MLAWLLTYEVEMTMKKVIARSALAAVLLVSTTQVAFSSQIPTSAYLDAQTSAQAASVAEIDSAKINAWLQREDVAQQLVDRGVSVQEAQNRLASLSDQDLRRVSAQLDNMPAGSSVLVVVGIVFVVLLVLELVGVTDVFKSV